jgi:hypothetical protein
LELDSPIQDLDQDGRPDHLDLDSDGDGIGDRFEGDCADAWRGPCDSDGDGDADVHDDDSDGDGLPDVQEGAGNADLDPPDTDRDGTPDFRDLDSDGDGVSDADETLLGLDARERDSDGDGFADGAEKQMGTDPADGTSVWHGRYVEVGERREREEKFEFDLRFERLDVLLLLPRFNDGDHAWFPSAFDALVPRLQAKVPDAAFGVATEGSYGMCPWSLNDGEPCLDIEAVPAEYTDVCGGVPSPPFQRWVAPDPDPEVAREAYAAPRSNQCFWRFASLEALQQIALDQGFDLNCDGAFDASDDLLPFRARPEDVFGGTQGGAYDPAHHAGSLGGVGFRPFSRKVIIHLTLTNRSTLPGLGDPPDLGSDYVNQGWFTGPPSCPPAATLTSAAQALHDADIARVHLALGRTSDLVDENGVVLFDVEPVWRQFAMDAGSALDLDGDGELEPLYFEHEWWPGGPDFPAEAFADTITDVVAALERKIEFERLSLVVEGDPHGLVASVDPPEHRGFELGDDDVAFTVVFRGTVPATEGDRVFKLYLNAVGDDRILLAREPVMVVIPGRQNE